MPSNKLFNLPEISLRALNELPEAVFWFDENGDFIEVNKVACKNWGYTREEFLKMSIFDVNPKMSPEHWKAHWAAKLADASPFESLHRRKNGEVFPVDITNNFVEYEGVVYSCSIVRDITNRKARNQRARLSDFTVQRTGDAVFWICPKGFIKRVNDEAISRYGYTEEEFDEMNILTISKDMNQASFREFWSRLKKEERIILEGVHYTKEDKKINVEISSNFILFEDMEYSCSIVRDITDRKMKESALRGALFEIKELKEQLEAENNYLQEEIEVQHNFGEIVSGSESFKKILKQIEQVADTTSTVMVTGESGTGKELIARALHQLSRRSNRPMIKVNCAALPGNLIESELFGHEKGAFTGALNKKIGRFELANGGTLFLDEIGEMPVELQPKLLRALQEGEIERVGGTETIKVEVRIIAATNRNLKKEIEKGTFREDLYYRLNVFPIHSIPLRNRREDIPILTKFFCEKLGTKLGKKITDIPQKVIDKLAAYDFPGNVRELENLVERAIIMSKRGKFSLGDWFNPKQKILRPESFDSLENAQRNHIIKVLQHTNWKVSGNSGAAALLDVKPTTLYSKIDKLGIKRSTDVAKD